MERMELVQEKLPNTLLLNVESHYNFCPCVASSLEEIYTVTEAVLDTECYPWQIPIELK